MSLVTTLTHRLREAQRPALAEHFLALGADDRRLRFGSTLSDDSVRAYVEGINFRRDELFAVTDDDLQLLGVVHVAFTNDTAELGLSVLQQARGLGIGNTLFERAVMRLRNRGASSVFVHCLSENQAMMHLARKHGMRLAYEGGESDAQLRLLPGTAETRFVEWAHVQQANDLQAVRQNARLARQWIALFAPAKP